MRMKRKHLSCFNPVHAAHLKLGCVLLNLILLKGLFRYAHHVNGLVMDCSFINTSNILNLRSPMKYFKLLLVKELIFFY